MAVSQNGWPLVTSKQLDNSVIPGTNVAPVPGILAGDVTTLLHWVGTQFNNTVAELYNPGCWGWNAPTPIPGSNIYSNHCSGTAIDFNAPSFPWTQRRMTPGQRQACRNIVAQTENVVIWGGDFTTVTDEMHFEINGTSADVTRIVNKLKGEDMQPLTSTQLDMLLKMAAQVEPSAEDLNNKDYLNNAGLAIETAWNTWGAQIYKESQDPKQFVKLDLSNIYVPREVK